MLPIYEDINDVVYHYTYYSNIYSILNDDAFRLSTVLASGTDAQLNRKRFFYMSTTRSKNTGYNNGTVRINLDRKKLKAKYKIIPVDFWNYRGVSVGGPSNRESEDRIISDESRIKNASKYIISIDILNESHSGTSELINFLREKNIPFNVFDKNSNTKKIVDYSKFHNKKVSMEPDEAPMGLFDFQLAAVIIFGNPRKEEEITQYIKSNFDDSENMITKMKFNTDKIFDTIFSDKYAIDEYIRDLNNRLAGERRLNKKSYEYLIKMLVADMRKVKTFTIAEYIEYIIRTSIVVKKRKFTTYIKNTLNNNFFNNLSGISGPITINEIDYDSLYDSYEFLKYITDIKKEINTIIEDAIYNQENIDITRLSYDNLIKPVNRSKPFSELYKVMQPNIDTMVKNEIEVSISALTDKVNGKYSQIFA